LYAGNSANFTLGKKQVGIVQKTDYPWHEDIVFNVEPNEPTSFTLALRIPDWTSNPTITVNDKIISPVFRNGYAQIKRTWQKSDKVTLTLPMSIKLIEANPNVRQVAGHKAIQRGPIIFCLEEVDNGRNLHDLTITDKPELTASFDKNLLGGTMVITGNAEKRKLTSWRNKLYSHEKSEKTAVKFKAIPYALWANRRPGEMRIWLNSR
jgi:DUF1680 family protein